MYNQAVVNINTDTGEGAQVFRALDLFCGAGGASMGLHRAGFEVVGVDIESQPRYPFDFLQADVMSLEFEPFILLQAFDLIWTSPPCQRFINSGLVNKKGRPDLITPMREILIKTDIPWVIENVPGAPVRRDLMLCGSMFGLPIRRHRFFEFSFGAVEPPGKCDHSEPAVGVYGHPHGERGAWPGMLPGTLDTWRDAMGIEWMISTELAQAIPPAYGEFIGRAAKQIVINKKKEVR